MAPVTNSNGLSYLTQPGGLLSNLPSSISGSALQSASPQDLLSLSEAALQVQQVDGLLGIQQSTPSTALTLPVISTQSGNVLPGVSSADLSNASPQQQAAINDQALLLQQVQGLFSEAAGSTSTFSLMG
jgi:hypothetical protein